MGYPQIRSYARTATTNSSGTSHVMTAPSSIVNGDLLVAVLSSRATQTGFTDGSGLWTLWQSNLATTSDRWAIYYKTASSESGNYTFGTSVGARVVGTIFSISGHNGTTPLAHLGVSRQTSALSTLARVTPANSANLMIAVSHMSDGGRALPYFPVMQPPSIHPVPLTWLAWSQTAGSTAGAAQAIGVFVWNNTQTPEIALNWDGSTQNAGIVFAVQSSDGVPDVRPISDSQMALLALAGEGDNVAASQLAMLVLGATASPSQISQFALLAMGRPVPKVIFTEFDTGFGK